MTLYTLSVNGTDHQIDVEPDMPLLWVLRDILDLTGTKHGCGIGACGICTVLVDGTARKSCVVPVQSVAGSQITTIEGLSTNGDHPVQTAWMEENVPQCGHCMPGQIMAAVALLEGNPNPSNAEIDAAMDKVLCRCGTYPRIRRAIQLIIQGGAP